MSQDVSTSDIDTRVTVNEGYFALGPEQQEWIRHDQVIMYPGRDPGKPVIRWAAHNSLGKKPGTLAPGGGVSPNNVDAVNGVKGGIKQTKEWKALLQRVVTAEDGGVFEEVIRGLVDSAKGFVAKVTYACEECGHKNEVERREPPNPLAAKSLIEFVIGRAPQYAEIDITAKSLHMTLAELTNVDPKDFITAAFTPEEVAERQRIVETVIVVEE